MVYKLFILIFLLSFKIGYTSIIYDKNEIIITDIEMNYYKNLYKGNYGSDISNNKAVKDIILIKKTISNLKKNNPELVSALDQKIQLEYGVEIFNNQELLNFTRIKMIRNEFISEYFRNFFSIEDLEIIFSNFNNLELPLSKKDCLTVERLYNVSNDKDFIQSFFEKLKNNNQKLETSINNELYEVCLNDKLLKNIESEIIKFIKNKTENDFDKFIYSNNN